MVRCKLQMFLCISILAISFNLNASAEFYAEFGPDFVMRNDALIISAGTKDRSPYAFILISGHMKI